MEKEANQLHNWVVIHDEADFKLLWHKEPVSQGSIKTPLEVYQELVLQGYRVKYCRIGITDEQSPEEKDFVILVDMLKTIGNDKKKYIFNCQMGRGRTTTGMVIACLMERWKKNDVCLAPSLYTRTEYKLIARLTRFLPNGQEDRRHVDYCIDMCSVMQNLRDAIGATKSMSSSSTDPNKIQFLTQRAVNYLKRYFYLILFQTYLSSQQQDNPFQVTFDTWVTKTYAQVYSLLEGATLECVEEGNKGTELKTP